MKPLPAALAAVLVATAAVAQPVPPPPVPPPPAPPAEHELMPHEAATSILGRQVRDPAGQTVGRIVDVLVDDFGMPRAAVIDFGGFMGVGNRRVAVAWRALHFVPAAEHGSITLEMTADQIKAIPEFRRPATQADPPVAVAVPPRPAASPDLPPQAEPSR